ncbi:MAG: alpha-galactosidase [Treponema sp.]|nr:alpha-galactosidase [Treponema sp.]
MRYKDSEVSIKTIPERIEGCGTFYECSCRYVGPVSGDGLSPADTENKIIAQFGIDSLLEKCAVSSKHFERYREKDFSFYGGGWQSWGFGGELGPGQKQKNYFPLIPQWKKYTTFPGKWPSDVGGKNPKSPSILKGQFLIYLRWENTYLVLASTAAFGNDDGNPLPPVQFYVDRKKRTVSVGIYADGKRWSRMELMGRLVVFSAKTFFALRDGVGFIFAEGRSERHACLEFLGGHDGIVKCAGWESWYNHYADINQKLIAADLDSLGGNGNIINSMYSQKNLPVVFQVDDGWEKSLGDWDANLERFPDGMTALATSISDAGYIPGLWIAPLIIDLRSETAKKHPDWILRAENGKPINAGMNPLWGAKFGSDQPSYPYSYFCLDLSRDDVLEHLDSLMEKAVNVWGFRYLKLDFLFAGMIDGKFANGGSAYLWYDRAVKKLTRRVINSSGERVAYLGCGLPFESSFMSFPLSRIGPDTKECWDIDWLRRINYTARTGAKPNLQSTLGHAFWDQKIFINDPDVIFLRYTNIKLDDGEKELIAMVNKMFASQIMDSDDTSDFSADDADFTEHVTNLYSQIEGEDFGLLNISPDVYKIFSRSGNFCGIINLSEKPHTLRKVELVNQVNYISGSHHDADLVELVPVVDNCVVAGDLYTSQKHTISVFKIAEAGGAE